MRRFVYAPGAARVVFGAGTRSDIVSECERLGLGRILIIATRSQAEVAAEFEGWLGKRVAGTTDRVAMHVPLEIAQAGRGLALSLAADGLIALGGGSAIGLAKAIALELHLPIVAVPTTYSGSEMTPVQGLTEGGVKRTVRDPVLLPTTVIYDPELTLGLPPRIAGASGMNAIAHAVEALYAVDANPITSLMAEEAIRALGSGLPLVVRSPDDLEARSQALYGAWLAGACLGTVGMALHHKLAHVLGGSFGLPHAETHAILLPHTAAYNQPAAADAIARTARALGVEDGSQGLFDLLMALGGPIRLADLGLAEEHLECAAELATRDPYPNPRPLTQEGLRALLGDAHAAAHKDANLRPAD